MRSTKITLSLLASSLLLLSACSSTKLDEKPPVTEATPSTTQNPTPTTADTHGIKTVEAPTVDPLDDPQGVLAKRSVYFDFDSYVVKDEFRPLVEAHAKYLVSKGRKILIQGNTDERGGREYNLALGQKRAEAVRKSMASLSVPDAQMEAVSLGKEKPKATGHDEAAWAENRRADIVY